MSKFYVVGYTKDEIARGVGLHNLDVYIKASMNPAILITERNNVLVYTNDGFEAKGTFPKEWGDYSDYEFIKDSFMVYLQPVIKLNVVSAIDESDLPKNLSIAIKL